MFGNPGSRRKRSSAAGFTLLEVIIALAIGALALVGLFRAGSDGIFATDTAAQTEEATERAQSHLAAFGRVGLIAPGELVGDDGGGYHWRLRATPIAVQPSAAQATGSVGAQKPGREPLALYDVEVTISWRGGRRNHSVTLETRRLVVAPGSE
jgi:prepilin-type N-terminal cleavage/methylation domain-containing protein